jgi:hypothetical protein
MLLIFSDKIDKTTNVVKNWLELYNMNYFIWYNEDSVRIKKIEINQIDYNIELYINDKVLSLNEIKYVWYRRGGINLYNFYDFIKNEENDTISEFYNSEILCLTRIIQEYIDTLPSLGNIRDNYLTKIRVLNSAKKVGFKIPYTLIVDEKTILENFNKKIINKSINNPINIIKDDIIYFPYTKEVDINRLPLNFFPAKFQHLIEKKIEVRTFIIGEKIFSAAIFSQNNKHTMIDYRNRKGPLNRIIPIQLNSDVNEKILKMMAELNLKSSSIDFIITKDDELVFLELNPVGQFGDISFYCNYNLEKEVVLFIKSELKVYA